MILVPLSKIHVTHLILLYYILICLESVARQKADVAQGHNWSKIENHQKTAAIGYENMACSSRYLR